ncbi:MAG TPA: cupin domain-containing protein [Sphingobium sp.]|nr:cupin domain-containing protein [Sphingobium sp.]
MTDAASLVIRPETGRIYEMGRITAIFKADGDETHGRYSISEWWLEPRTKGPGLHSHPEDHIFYVIAGTLDLIFEDSSTQAPKGTYVIIPGGTAHDFENQGAERVGFISLNAPGGFESLMPRIAPALANADLHL